MNIFSLSCYPLNVEYLSREMHNPEAGAFASFEGWVRNNNEGRQVDALEYEVFETLALEEGHAIVAEAIKKFGLTSAHAVHRSGSLKIGDCAVWIGVTAPHRGEAFAACRAIIDEIKHRLPVWKKEFYADGTDAWVNCSHAAHEAPRPKTSDERYRRQKLLPECGEIGQQKLADAKVLVVGVGGLGSSAALALAAAGVGTLGLIEDDRLEESNLHRQILYRSADVGHQKAEMAARQLSALNPNIAIKAHDVKLTTANAERFLKDYDLILDCTDNFKTKYLLNDAALLFGKPVIQASLYRFEGQLLKISPHTEGCLRCLWPTPPNPGVLGDCAETGVLGTVPITIGTLQANEAIKHILGVSNQIDHHLVTIDLMTLSLKTHKRQRDPHCALCGLNPTRTSLEGDKPMPYEISPEPMDSIVTLGLRFRVVDVREDYECDQRPIVSDYRIPLSRFDVNEIRMPQNAQLLVVCEKGHRSLAAVEMMRKQGWNNTYSLRGGLSDLQDGEDLGKADQAA